ncbi:MAG: hypothetical protein SO116_04160 [Treponema sp.]|nr:hypothetical protein [Spirochaetia bacterium]MDY4902047.1 hypothetical protein [Treponema sp.]
MNLLFKSLAFIFSAWILLLNVSCKKSNYNEIKIEDNVITSADEKWAVIVEPYAAFRSECNFDSTVENHGRKGEVLPVKGNALVKEEHNEKLGISSYKKWYYFEKGWLPEETVRIYDNKFRCESASARLLENN